MKHPKLCITLFFALFAFCEQRAMDTEQEEKKEKLFEIIRQNPQRPPAEASKIVFPVGHLGSYDQEILYFYKDRDDKGNNVLIGDFTFKRNPDRKPFIEVVKKRKIEPRQTPVIKKLGAKPDREPLIREKLENKAKQEKDRGKAPAKLTTLPPKPKPIRKPPKPPKGGRRPLLQNPEKP